MTEAEVRELPNGLYRIFWNGGGGMSIAAVGRDAWGMVWLAPTNWITVPSVKEWHRVESVELIATQEDEAEAAFNSLMKGKSS